MCEAFRFRGPEGRIQQVEFADPAAQLTGVNGKGAVRVLRWGRRPAEAGALPIGPYITKPMLAEGAADKFLPMHLKLSPAEFCVRNQAGRAVWHTLVHCYWILGVILRDGEEERAYVVSVTSPEGRGGAWPWIEMTPRLPLFLRERADLADRDAV